jgi:hypothetical protein
VIRVAGLTISIVAALVSAFLELFTTTLRVGGVLIGVSILMAPVLNMALAWFAVTTTGRRWAVAVPWAAWTLVMLVVAPAARNEGDRLLGADNWVAVVMILAGSLAYAIYSYRMILPRPIVTKV